MDFKKVNDEDLKKLEEYKLGPLETQLAHILIEGVPDSYQPSENVLSMAVACGRYTREASMIRAFHKSRFHISSNKVVVIGCDLDEPISKKPPAEDDYDLMLRGYVGDASRDNPWNEGLRNSGNGHVNYDFAHINYPDLFDIDSWLPVTRKALEHLSKGGVLSIINVDFLDETELERLSKLQKELKQTEQYKVDEIQGFRYETSRLVCFNYGLLCVQKTAD